MVESEVENLSRAYRAQFVNVKELFGGDIWILSQSKKHYKYDKYEAQLLYEFLARNNDIEIWKKINKQYLQKYRGFLDLYNDLPLNEKEELIRELKFIIDLILKLYEHRSQNENKVNLRAHLNAVTQLPLMEIWELFRRIPYLKYEDYCNNPFSLQILYEYHEYINRLKLKLEEDTKSITHDYLINVYEYFIKDALIKDENVQKDPLMGGIINGIIDEHMNPDNTDEMLESLKDIEPDCKEASTLNQFHDLQDSVSSSRTITKNKIHDKKAVKKLIQ